MSKQMLLFVIPLSSTASFHRGGMPIPNVPAGTIGRSSNAYKVLLHRIPIVCDFYHGWSGWTPCRSVVAQEAAIWRVTSNPYLTDQVRMPTTRAATKNQVSKGNPDLPFTL
jgi:hypothetical protein